MVVSVDGAPIGNAQRELGELRPTTRSRRRRRRGPTRSASPSTTTTAHQTEDRNLYVAKVAVGCGAGARRPARGRRARDWHRERRRTGVDCGGSCAACAPRTRTAQNSTRSNLTSTGGGVHGTGGHVLGRHQEWHRRPASDCGGSCAACAPACPPTTYAAESMTHSIGGSA